MDYINLIFQSNNIHFIKNTFIFIWCSICVTVKDEMPFNNIEKLKIALGNDDLFVTFIEPTIPIS